MEGWGRGRGPQSQWKWRVWEVGGARGRGGAMVGGLRVGSGDCKANGDGGYGKWAGLEEEGANGWRGGGGRGLRMGLEPMEIEGMGSGRGQRKGGALR